MATKSLAPVKVDPETDQLINDAAHMMHMSKKDLLAAAVRDYVAAHREQLRQSMTDTLRRLDGSDTSLVSLLTGMSPERLEKLGGVGS